VIDDHGQLSAIEVKQQARIEDLEQRLATLMVEIHSLSRQTASLARTVQDKYEEQLALTEQLARLRAEQQMEMYLRHRRAQESPPSHRAVGESPSSSSVTMLEEERSPENERHGR
jgi:hypothetical protein